MLLTLLRRLGKTLSSVAVGLTDYVSEQIISEEEGEQSKWRQLTRLFTVRDSGFGLDVGTVDQLGSPSYHSTVTGTVVGTEQSYVGAYAQALVLHRHSH